MFSFIGLPKVGYTFFSGAIFPYINKGLSKVFPSSINAKTQIPPDLGFTSSSKLSLGLTSEVKNHQEPIFDKIKRVVLSFLLGIMVTISYSNAFASESKEVQPIISSNVSGIKWVQLCMNQYPEISWLADEQVRKTEEGLATAKGAYSEQLFSKKFIEFDRTMMTLRCLQLVLDGGDAAYQEFTKAQSSQEKLSRASFKELHKLGTDLLKSQYRGLSELEMAQAMEASLVLGDIGKSGKAREIFKAYGANAPDHDDFHEEAIQILKDHSYLCPTFAGLSSSVQKLLIETANLAHYGHITASKNLYKSDLVDL